MWNGGTGRHRLVNAKPGGFTKILVLRDGNVRRLHSAAFHKLRVDGISLLPCLKACGRSDIADGTDFTKGEVIEQRLHSIAKVECDVVSKIWPRAKQRHHRWNCSSVFNERFRQTLEI